MKRIVTILFGAISLGAMAQGVNCNTTQANITEDSIKVCLSEGKVAIKGNAVISGEEGRWAGDLPPTTENAPNTFAALQGAGDYTMFWTISKSGCEPSIDSVVIQVEEVIKPEINLSLVGTSPKCQGTSIDVQADVTGTNGLMIGTHQWQRDNVDTAVLSSTFISVPADKLWFNKITYKMDYSAYECIDPSSVIEQSISVDVVSGPHPLIGLYDPSDAAVCNKPVSVQLTTPVGTTNGAQHKVEWFVNNTLTTRERIDSLVVTKQANIKNYTIRAEESNGVCPTPTKSNDVFVVIEAPANLEIYQTLANDVLSKDVCLQLEDSLELVGFIQPADRNIISWSAESVDDLGSLSSITNDTIVYTAGSVREGQEVVKLKVSGLACVDSISRTFNVRAKENCINNVFNTQSTQKLSFYPNPVSGNEITIEGEELKIVTITNQLGQKVLNKNIEQNTVDISKLEKGIYIISVSTSNGDIYTEKLIKE